MNPGATAFNLSQFANNVNSAGVAQTGGGGTGTNIASNDLTVNGLTVGKGGGSIAGNTAIGNQSLYSNTTASNNTAVGYQAGYSTTTSTDNTYFGKAAGYSLTTGSGANVFVGQQTGYSATTGANNAFLGSASGYYMTTGSKNTIIGSYSGNQGGLDIRTASNYIVLSDGDGNPRQVIDSSGNVGIGRTPDQRLQIAQSSAVEFDMFVGTTRTLSLYADATQTILAAPTAIPMIFQTNATERMRIDSSGNVFVGATSGIGANERFGVYRSDNGTSGVFATTNASQTNDIFQIRANRNTTNSSYRPIIYYNDAAGAYRFIVADSGNVTNTNGSYGTISDVRLKENIVDATSKLDKVNQLKVRNFNLIGDDLKQIGFVAQEFEDVFPSMVEESQDKTPDGEVLETTTKTIKTTVLIPILVKAIQEQQALITDLQARLTKAGL